MCPIFNNFLPLKNISNSKLVLVFQNCPNYFIHSKKCLFFIKIVRLTTKLLSHVCTVFRKAYILSGYGFHEFLYSIIESLKKIVKLLSLFLISCVFTKKTLANFRDMEILHKRGNRKVQKNIILSMFEQKLFNFPC